MKTKIISHPLSNRLNNGRLKNYNTLEFKTDFNSPINRNNRPNISSNTNLTYLLTKNANLNLKTEPDDNYYPKQNLEYFQTFNNNHRNNYSEKIKMYRENLNEIVNKLNESNNKYKKIINRNSDYKENISLINNYNNKNYNEYFTQTPKYITNHFRNNKLNKLVDSFTNAQRNKNAVIKNLGDKTEIRNKKRLLDNDNKDYYLNKSKDNLIINNIHDTNRENDNLNNLNKLRNEFKEISSNYLEVSQQIDRLNKSEKDNDNSITYDEIIKNSSKLNDIISYNYKENNDIENEKIFILMKLRLKNAQIIINKLENEKKKYKEQYNKKKNISKINKKLENENKNLKNEIEELNTNLGLIQEELEDFKNKFNNMNIFNKKIQEKNEKLTKENNNLKNNIEKINNKEKQLKELNEKYNKISEENKNLKILIKDIQSKYGILQEIHLEFKQKNNNDIKLLKDEIDNLNKNCQNYEKQISELKNSEKKLKNANKNLNKEKNNIENKYQELIKKNDEDKKTKIKETFGNLYKKYAENKIKENKLKMIIGIYLQKQNINFNKQIKEYKATNKKLVKSVRKLNDQIIEFKLNKLNNNSDM